MTRLLFILLALISCGELEQKDGIPKEMDGMESDTTGLRYLALGDSYTIGESVSENQRFPYQLINAELEKPHIIQSFQIIAKTGWTTADLLAAMDKEDLKVGAFNFITLLIGVNNQYQGKPFSQYETEYNELMDRSIALLEGDSSKLIVVSIPDYSVTPFASGGNTGKIASEIEKYNNYKEKITKERGAHYVYITDLTQNAEEDLSLLADDQLHPSGKNYGQWVDRMIPVLNVIIDKL